MDVDFASVLLFGAVSLCSAALAMVVGGRVALSGDGPEGVGRGMIVVDAAQVYEFFEGYLVSPIDAGDPFLDPGTDRSRALELLCYHLDKTDAQVSDAVDRLRAQGEPFILTVPCGADALSVAGRRERDRLVLTVAPLAGAAERKVVDAAVLADLNEEARELRAALDRTDTLVWRTGADGTITWCNSAYHRALDAASGNGAGELWPVPSLFDIPDNRVPRAEDDHRAQLTTADGSRGPWYRLEGDEDVDGARLWVAHNIDRIVDAEQARRSFVQTLSKTFAHMTTGLAVFDRNRGLMLFNPALSQITDLDPIFLSRRPTLDAFLDQLREIRRMPEPRDYKSWRKDMSRLEEDAVAGTYQQLWSLPDGTTLRVIGRPHPDGALALFFEDISSEMRLTRAFREKLQLHQAVLDADPAAVAVFGRDGKLLLSNAGYVDLCVGSDTTLAQDMTRTIAAWQAHFQHGHDLDAMIAALADPAMHLPWQGRLRDNGDRPLEVICQRLLPGATEIRFVRPDTGSAAQHRRSALDLAKTAAMADAARGGNGAFRSKRRRPLRLAAQQDRKATN